MNSLHWNVLLIYLGFTFVATLLALVRRWLRHGEGGESVWRKYPTYILINLGFLAASWSPAKLHALTILLATLGALVSWEIARALLQPRQTFLFPIITFVLIAFADYLDMTGWFQVWLAVFLIVIFIHTLTGRPADYARSALAAAGCVIYLPMCIAAYLWIQHSEPSGFRAAFLYLLVATNDALAQITGQLIGRRQLAPQISPAKTIEGAVGGVFFACMMGIALSPTVDLSYIAGGISGLILGVAGLVGDLTASTWKRALEIKNYSGILGAQGGVLDRFDGLIFAAPVFYLLLAITG